MNWTTHRKRLRNVLAGSGCTTMASVWDPITSRLAERMGYEASLVGGTFISYAVLAAPDLILLTLTELAEQVHRCARVSTVPMIVDGDHGFGNALNVMRTVHEMDAAGAGAVTIEDTLLPRPFGNSDAAQLVPFDEAVGKIKAAVKARGDSDLLIMGRSGAAAVSGVDDAIARFRAFEAAGADALFLPGPKNREIVDAISSATRVPLVLAGSPEAVCDPTYLASRRVKAWAAGHHTFAVALKALSDGMQAVKDGTLSARLPGQASAEAIDDVTAANDYRTAIASFLRPA